MADLHSLPTPTTAEWDWQLHGACRNMGENLFFHPDRERGPARQRREAAAKKVCHRCPVIERCRSHALAVREPYGVWGGLSETERDVLVRTYGRPRGRRIS